MSGNLLEMPEVDVREMLADWSGASKSQKTKGVKNWYAINGIKLLLHWNTRQLVEKLMEKYF